MGWQAALQNLFSTTQPGESHKMQQVLPMSLLSPYPELHCKHVPEESVAVHALGQDWQSPIGERPKLYMHLVQISGEVLQSWQLESLHAAEIGIITIDQMQKIKTSNLKSRERLGMR